MAILEAGGGMEAGTEMCAVAALGQTGALSEFLQHGALPDQGDYDARTALHLAASEGHLETVRFLIEDAGAHHSPVDRWGGTPLDDAVRGQKHDVINFLREVGGRAQRGGAAGKVSRVSDLSSRVGASRRRLLPGLGAKTAATPAGAAPSEGFTMTPLMAVAPKQPTPERARPGHRRGSSGGSFRRSMSAGALEELNNAADGSVSPRRGSFRRASAKGDVSESPRLLRRLTTSWRLSEGAYAVRQLCAAAANGDIEALRNLVFNEGVDVNQSDYDHRTPLHLAASEGLLPVVVFLLEDAHAEHSPVDRWGGTPLDDVMRAMMDVICQESRWHDVAAYLRSRGATKGLASKDEASLLCSAAEDGWVHGLRELIFSQGLSPDLSNYDGRTPMHAAAARKHLEVLRFLVEEAHAQVNPTDRWGDTPLDDAVRHGDTTLVTYLWTHGANLGRPHTNGKSLELLAGAMVFKSRLGELVLIDADDGEAYGHTGLAPNGGEGSRRACEVARKGWLHKLSRGGRATWQRRYFALAGSTLYYANDPDVIQAEPRLFAECASVRVMQAPAQVKGHDFVFALVLPMDDALAGNTQTGQPFELLLLRAESDEERDGWAAAIMHSGRAEPCPTTMLAALLTYRLHQEENDGLTTVYRWDGSKDVGREQSLMVAPPAPAEAGRSLGWAERCVQCLPIAPVASEAAERQVLASDANEMVFGPLERAIAGCFRNLRVV